MRKKSIVEHINNYGNARVSDLAIKFSVSEKTIRRDLKYLEGLNKLVRVTGGAVSLKNSDIGTTFSSRSKKNSISKNKLVEQAIPLIKEGDLVGLDASSSCWKLAQSLPDIKITVVTNSLRIIKALNHKKNISIFSLPGNYSRTYEGFYGLSTVIQVEKISLDIFFMSCSGFNIEGDIWDSNKINADLKRAYIKSSKSRVLIADLTKKGKASLIKICKTEDFDIIIST
ncbi:L-fucose operon activator [Vibrio ishigakensis]|uniref:L-fucose operon activator n=1 Tax=Vibrio ishigakensis TaxID=1481914 RepID=A0A0B8P4B4_9VIBR|nr:DeoR/GlpR family DNA-binding transcription regulator [Vibrio ishigakensis]GAM58133.1 L-fucose operon activator [Vibrio ishigakensis]